MATPGKTNKGTKRPIQAKSSLFSPFKNLWQPLHKQQLVAIQMALRIKFESVKLKKMETKGFRKLKERKNKKPSVTAECEAPQSQCDPVQTGWTDTSARRQLAVGINEVTRALERNGLRLLLVCGSAKPKHMTKHLIALSISREVPACQVYGLSGIVSEALRLKSVLALGFRRCLSLEEDIYSDVVSDISSRVPPLHVAWLEDKGAPTGAEKEQLDYDKRGHKRKLEHEPELHERHPETVASEATACTLQQLCVKKVIPNPQKRKKNTI